MCLLVINDGKYLLLVLCLTLLLLVEYTWVQFISREKKYTKLIFFPFNSEPQNQFSGFQYQSFPSIMYWLVFVVVVCGKY